MKISTLNFITISNLLANKYTRYNFNRKFENHYIMYTPTELTHLNKSLFKKCVCMNFYVKHKLHQNNKLIYSTLHYILTDVNGRNHLTVSPENVLFQRGRTIGRGVLNEWGSLGMQRSGQSHAGPHCMLDIYLVCRGLFWISRSLTYCSIQNKIAQA